MRFLLERLGIAPRRLEDVCGISSREEAFESATRQITRVLDLSGSQVLVRFFSEEGKDNRGKNIKIPDKAWAERGSIGDRERRQAWQLSIMEVLDGNIGEEGGFLRITTINPNRTCGRVWECIVPRGE